MRKDLKTALAEIGLENDTISLMVDSYCLQEIKSYYQEFGWIVKEEKQDKYFHKAYHLVFIRNHFIPNKEKLQLLEVKFESNVHELNKLKFYEHSKSTITGLINGFIGLIAFVIGLLAFFDIFGEVNIAFPICLVILGSLIMLINPLMCTKIYKDETKLFDEEFIRLTTQRKNIIEETRKARKE